jgi:hypothetical protein
MPWRSVNFWARSLNYQIMSKSHLEETFTHNWGLHFPEISLSPEYRFTPPRKFRFDFAHLESKVAVELQGAIFTGGRHSRGSGLINEHIKCNLAAQQGWRIFYLSANTINDFEIYQAIANTIKNYD